METIKAKYHHTRYTKAGDPCDTGYRVIEYKTNDDNIITTTGYYLGELTDAEYTLTGTWTTNKYGKQFSVSAFEEYITPSKTGITTFLTTLKGIGEKTAEAIYDVCGMDTLSLLDTNPDGLYEKMQSSSKKKSLTKKKYQTMMNSYAEKKGAKEAITLLAPFGISPKTCVKLYNIYGADTGNVIKTNPYRLTEIKGIGFIKADEIGRAMGIPKTSKSRIKACIYHVLQQNEINGFVINGENISGSTCLPKLELLRLTKELLNTPTITDNQISVAAMELLKSNKIHMAMDHIYRTTTYNAEKNTAISLININTNFAFTEIVDIEKLIDEAEDNMDIELDVIQRNAVANALQSGVNIITGGPGTGKTLTLSVFAYCYKKLYPKNEILFLAPTGKAARRITESTGYPASTIHKALQLYDSEDYKLDEVDDLGADLVVVDEVSMLDTWVASALFGSIKRGAQLVLVGDIDQLESVGCGAVLRDVIDSGVVSVTKLEKIFRQKSKNLIALNSAKIRKGNTDLEKGSDFIFLKSDSTDDSAEQMKNAYLSAVKMYGEDNVVCLCPFRKRTASSVDAMNIILQEELNPLNGRNEIKYGNVSFREGDRVMALKNSEEVANGEVGIIKEIDVSEKTIVIDFGTSKVTYVSDELDQIAHAYAMSIHKSQGSEYTCVITNFLFAHKIMLKRNLLYTAITRAKKSCVVIGQAYALKSAIETISANKRITLLKEMLVYFDKEAKKKKNPFDI